MTLPAATGERWSCWRVRLAASAEADYGNILRWTAGHFGTQQARRYAETLQSAVEELTEGPDVPGFRDRPDIGAGIRILHVARRGRHGRHSAVPHLLRTRTRCSWTCSVCSTTAWTFPQQGPSEDPGRLIRQRLKAAERHYATTYGEEEISGGG